jgi:hypothetical protein
MKRRIGFLVSHPIQYYAPIFRELAQRCDLTVFFAHKQDAAGQGKAGYGVAFDWDVDLLSGYENRFLKNVARVPSTQTFAGCNTPEIAEEISAGRFDAFVVPGWSPRGAWADGGRAGAADACCSSGGWSTASVRWTWCRRSCGWLPKVNPSTS